MPNGMKRALTVVVSALVCYCLLGFLILPGVAQRIANQQLARYATAPASLERIELNPFTLELTAFNLSIGEPGARQVAFERLYLNLSWDSLWTRTLHLADIQLDRPAVQAEFDLQGTLNLSRLFELPPSPEPAAEGPREVFPLRIDRLRLADGDVGFRDLRPSEAIDLRYDALNIELHNLATRSDGSADASLVANGPSGGRIAWQGQFGLAPITSSGKLKADGLLLKDIWPYVHDIVPLQLQDGRLDVSTAYRLDLSEGTRLLLDNAKIKLAPLAIDDPDGKALIRLESLEIDDTALDLTEQRITIGNLRSSKLETWAARNADGTLDWQTLFARPTPSRAATPEPLPEAAAETPAADSTNDPTSRRPWQVLVRNAELRDYRIHLADRVPEQDVALDVGPLDLTLRDFDSLGTSPFQLALQSGIGRQGSLQAEGQLQLSPASGTLAISTRDIDLRIAQAYLSPFVHLELRSGLLDSQLKAELQSTEPLAFSVTGQADITQLHTLDTIGNRDLAKWERLHLEEIDYRHPQSLSIAKVQLQQSYARFIINPDLTTNINDLLIKQPEPATASPKAAQPEPASALLALHIGGIEIADGSANFADLSLRPPFGTAIQGLNGRIGTLDNRQQKPAAVDIKGKVDRYAPVSIKGQLTPFDPLQSLDIATSFKQVELTTLTPYSSKFAGYRIRKGRLNLDLHYRIQQGQLNAENKVVVEQLQLGEKVDSPDAVDLPIRLAVALLKDTKGTISIELPVTGNLNDPQFSVMPIVWQTLRNLVLRAAQAPFKFIAGLVDGDQVDLSQIAFAAGSSELDDEARKALDTLVDALQQRPALRLEVEGMAAGSSDGPLLAEQRLQREYQQTQYRILQRRGDKVPADPSLLQVEEEDKAVLLEGIYRSRLKQQPPAQWKELEDDERAARLREAVIASWAQSSALLRTLSRDRAAAIKGYLVDHGLDAERVFLLDTGTTEPLADGRVATALHLGSE
ncbi:DUF748 domain-containing protein [Pseudomonas stutzeri]|nr:DUF748 domain-containing protein [Stutzerimonas degradans]